MSILETTKEFLKYPGISGFEMDFSTALCEKLKKYCPHATVNKTGCVLGCIESENAEARTVMLEAHLDRIGLIVSSVDENGFVSFATLGGVDERILPGAEVWILGNEKVFGVIGAKPPHIMDKEESKGGISAGGLLIDTGLGKKAAEFVSVGDPILLDSKFCELMGGKISSAALDNRVSIAAVFEVLEELKGEKLPVNLSVAFTSGEESGLLGAYTLVGDREPDLAVVIDVTYGRTPDADGCETFPLGSGAAILRGPNVHYEYTKKLMNVAKKKGIPFEIEVARGSSGTTAWAFQTSGCGVPCVIISIPLRYMHTTVETVDLSDVECVCRLLKEIICGGEVIA